MKQLVLLTAMMAAGMVGSFYHPFWGVLLYYTLAVLRPQYLWDWALPTEIRWSMLAAGVVLMGVLANPRTMFKGNRINAVAVLMLVYSLLLLASTLGAYDPLIAQDWAVEYLKILVMALVATFVIQSITHIEGLALMIALVITYLSYEVNFSYIVNGRLDIFLRGLGGLDNNGAGLMVAMGLPIVMVYITQSPKRWQRGAAAAAAVMVLHSVLMSYSRGAMMAALVGVGWLLWHHRPRWQSAGFVAALALVVSLLAGAEIRARFLSSKNIDEDASINSRFDSWAAAWEIAKDHPFTGAGIRNANIYSMNYGADVAGRTIHNQYLQIAADSGIPAMLVYIVMVTVALVSLGRARRQCLDAIEWSDPGGLSPAAEARLRRLAQTFLGFQASLLVFAFGGIFLSLEVFELPWMLLMLGGLAPAVIRADLPNIVDSYDERLIEVVDRATHRDDRTPVVMRVSDSRQTLVQT